MANDNNDNGARNMIPLDEPHHGKQRGRSVAGKDLSDSQSSGRKGRKSSTSRKKLEQEAK